MTPDQKVEALRLADALELEGEPRRSDKYAAADLLRALAAEPAPESAVQSETVRRNMLNSDPFASLFGTFGRLSQRELHIMNAALTLVADQPAPEPVAKMNMPLIWLYSH